MVRVKWNKRERKIGKFAGFVTKKRDSWSRFVCIGFVRRVFCCIFRLYWVQMQMKLNVQRDNVEIF